MQQLSFSWWSFLIDCCDSMPSSDTNIDKVQYTSTFPSGFGTALDLVPVLMLDFLMEVLGAHAAVFNPGRSRPPGSHCGP